MMIFVGVIWFGYAFFKYIVEGSSCLSYVQFGTVGAFTLIDTFGLKFVIVFIVLV